MHRYNDKPGTREKTSAFYIFGIRPVMEAIEAGKTLESFYIQKGLTGELLQSLKKLAADAGIRYQAVPVEKLNRITQKAHQGVIAYISPVTYQKIEDIIPQLFEAGAVPLILVLDRITDVRNLGAIARSAECLGAHALVVPSKGSAQINEDAVKTSAGAIVSLPVCKEENLQDALHYLKNSGLTLVAANEKADTAVEDVNLTGPTAILLGSEEDGVLQAYLKMAQQAKIDLYGKISSLNVSVSAGILLYEVQRQRKATRS